MVIDNDTEKRIFEAGSFKLAGEARRKDAALAAEAVLKMLMVEAREKGEVANVDAAMIVNVMNEFPGVGRRFEKIVDGLYTDYAHHPEEIAATVEIALEQAKMDAKAGVVVVYQPHQNTRQHKVKNEYAHAFDGATKVFWLPTYLTREDPLLNILTNTELAALVEGVDAEAVELNDELKERLDQYLKDNYLVVLMTAGPADTWLREKYLTPQTKFSLI
jgi:UDP-N-acetylmuramate--alanine ligase